MIDDPTVTPWSLFGRRHAVVPGRVPVDLVSALLADEHRHRYGRGAADRQVSIASPSRTEVRRAMNLLSELAAACHLGGPFHPTEVSYHRVPVEHRDAPRRENRYYAECVALVVLCGAGQLTVHDERVREHVLDVGWIRPGDVVLLRGWSPLGAADPRPYHRVTATSRPLTLFRARHNLASDDPPSAWLDCLTSREVREATLRAALTGSPARSGG